MNINLISFTSIPHSSAESIHIVLTAESLAKYCNLTLYSTAKIWRHRTFSKNLGTYGIRRPSFNYKKILQFYPNDTFNLRCSIHSNSEDIFYCRQGVTTSYFFQKGQSVIWEQHGMPSNADMEFLKGAIDSPAFLGLVLITNNLKQDILAVIGKQHESKLHVLPDSADIRRFPYDDRLVLSPTRVGYIGSNYVGKGYEIIRDLIQLCDKEFNIYGFNELNTKNAAFFGRIPYSQIPAAMESFDIGLLPNQPSVRMVSGDDIGKYTSPMKMFEYMASGRVIIASDIPVIREVLTNEVNALLVPHDDPTAWKEAIDRLCLDNELYNSLRTQARKDVVENYSYDIRSKSLLDLI